MSYKKFLYNLFHKREGLSYFLFSIVFLCFLIAIVNFTTSYLHCRRDIARLDDLYLNEKNKTVTDDVNTVVLDTVITTIITRDTVTVNIVVRDTVKNDYSRHCTHSSLEDAKRSFETLEDLHKTFDNNLLTFLISFVLVALLSLVLDERGKIESAVKQKKEELESAINQKMGELGKIESAINQKMGELGKIESAVNQKMNDLKGMEQSIAKQMIEIADKEVNVHRKIWHNVHIVSSLYYESRLLASIIESSRFIINDTVSASISKLCIGVDDFNREIPAYSHQLKEEAVFAEDDIDSMLDPLYDVQQGIGDLIRSARDYESKLKKRNPHLVPDLETQLSPVESSVDALIRKIEGYRAAPKNRQA